MIIAGAGGHAREIAFVLQELNFQDRLFFYDDLSFDLPDLLFDRYRILKSRQEVIEELKTDDRFALGTGEPRSRSILANKFAELGGKLTSIISPSARVGTFNVELGNGINVMPGAVITNDIHIGTGTLVHVMASVHHNCRVEEFSELLPGCRILGNVTIGSYSSIGSNAVILPKVKIGNHVRVGAGAVVTRDVPNGIVVTGVPARPK
jgi:sugar O-acyltransferase (sialic acid O-acetyltransferase NeuD family)